MPIYAYRCETCGHEKDVIQKFSDAPLTVCPSCGADAFRKQLTAPSFQLKGSGWYVTDFRDGGKAAGAAKADAAKSEGAVAADGTAPAAGKGGGKDGGKDSGKDSGSGTGASAGAGDAPAKPASGGGDAPSSPAKPASTT